MKKKKTKIQPTNKQKNPVHLYCLPVPVTIQGTSVPIINPLNPHDAVKKFLLLSHFTDVETKAQRR